MHLHLPAPAPPCPAEVSWGDAHRGGLEGCEDLGQSALGWDSPTFRLVSELHLGSSPSSIKQELGLGSQSRFRPSRLRPWPPPQPFESCRAAFFKYLRSQKQVKNIWALPAGMREGKFNGRLPAPRAFRGSAGARARAKNFKLFSLMPLFFFGGGGRQGRGEAAGNEVPKQSVSALLLLAPAPPPAEGEDFEFQTRNPFRFEIDRFYPGASNRNQERGL